MVAWTAVVVVVHLPQAWFCSLVLAPEATKYATAFFAIGAIAFTLASCGIVQSRETARSNQVMNNLRQISFNNAALPHRISSDDSWAALERTSIWLEYSTDASSNVWAENLLTDPAGGKLSDFQSAEPPTSE